MPLFDATSLVVGITGHRDLHPADVPAIKAQLRAFFLHLTDRYPHLSVVVLSSLAEGGDQIAAQVALDLGLRVIAPLPLPVALYREDFDPAGSLVFEEHLQRAEILELPLRHGIDIEAVARRGPARDRQYAQAGIFVSSHCHVLLALWDGCPSDRLGGTAQMVRFHLRGELPGAIERRRDTTLALLGLDEETVVHHLPVRRSTSEVPPPLEGRWLTAKDEVVAHPVMPETFDRMFEHQAEFNADCLKYAEAMAADRAAPETENATAFACPIHRLFAIADWLARIYQQRVNRVLRIVYLLAAAMGFTFFLYTHIATHYLIINLFLVFFLGGLGVVLVSRRREWQRKYLDYRALAEGLRVQSYWRRAGISDLHSPAFAHDNFVHRQDSELGWIRNVMRSASLDGLLVPDIAGEEQVDMVIDEWIGSRKDGGQLAYFASAMARRERMHRRAELAGLLCLWAGVGISAVLAIFSRWFQPHFQHVLVSSMGILSVAGGVHEAYAYKKADKELIKQYQYMQRIFGAARRRLAGCRSIHEKRQVLRTLGEAALAEHAEWTLMHRERPLEHSRL
jgi:hypothetical protein